MTKCIQVALVITFLLSSQACDSPVSRTSQLYYKELKPLARTKSFSKQEFCGALGKDCGDVTSLIEHIDDQLPDIYFSADAAAPPDYLEPTVRISVQYPEDDTPTAYDLTQVAPGTLETLLQHVGRGSNDFNEELDKLGKLLWTIHHGQRPRNERGSAADPFQEIRITVSVSLNSSNYGDHLEKLYAFIYIPKDATIARIRRLETQRSRLELGRLISEGELSSRVAVQSPGVAGAGSIAGELSSAHRRALTQTLNKEFVRLTMDKNSTNTMLTIRQEAPSGIDISGNVVADITLRHKGNNTAFRKFFNVKVTKDSKLESFESEERYVLDGGSVNALLAWVAQVRTVESGGDTLTDGDDVVTPRVFKGVRALTLWQNRTQIRVIGIPHSVKQKNVCELAFLVHEGVGGKPRLVTFTSMEDALKFHTALIGTALQLQPPLGTGAARPLQIHDDLKVGFTIAPSGELDEETVNISWKDKETKEPIDIRKIDVYVTDPEDFPIVEKYPTYNTEFHRCPQPNAKQPKAAFTQKGS